MGYCGMKTCLNCETPIEDKTKSGKSRTFCGKSCGRKYTCRTKPEVVQEANKRGFQTLLRENPDVVSSRGRMTEKKRVALKKLEEQGHFHRMSALSSHEYDTEAQQAKRKQSMIKKGLWVDYAVFSAKSFKEYRQAATNLTRTLHGHAGKGFHWDHIVPVKYGFENGIAIELICSVENVKRVPAKENLSKGSKLTEESKKILEDWGTAA